MDLDAKFQKICPLMHLFLSNDAPSDHEQTQLTSLLRETEAELEPLAAQLNMKKDRLLLYNPLHALCRSLKGAMSPIRRLPVEILSQILLECLPARHNRSWSMLKLEWEPWNLVRVCKKWRKLALGDHRLWSSVALHAGPDLTRAPERYRELTLPTLEAFLARYGDHLRAVDCMNNTESILLPQFSPYSERLEYLGFCFTVDPHVLLFLEQIKGRLTELRELQIHHPSYLLRVPFESAPLPATFDFFEDVPKLQQATICLIPPSGNIDESGNLTLWMDPAQFKLPWHQLTSLDTDHLALLNYCPQLVKLRLLPPHRGDVWPHFFNPYPVIVHSNLRKLLISHAQLLDRLVLPSLEFLSPGWHDSMESTRERVCSLISRSRCTLKSLDLRSGSVKGWPCLPDLNKGLPDLLKVFVGKRHIDLDDTTGWHLIQDYGNEVFYEKDL